MRSLVTGTALFVVLSVALLPAMSVRASAAVFSVEMGGGRSDTIEAKTLGGLTYFRLADVARAVGASRHWNPRTSKMTLAVGIHRLSMSEDSPFVSLDGEAVNVGRPILFLENDYWVPARFLTDPLGLSVNSEVTIDPDARTIMIAKLGAVVTAIAVEERAGGAAAIVSLNDRVGFAVRSRERGRIDAFLPGAVLADSMDVVVSEGPISSVAAEPREDGVRIVVRVAPSATSYDAEMHTKPPRLEITVRAERAESIPLPELKGVKDLVASGGGVFDLLDDGVETVMIDPGHGGHDAGKVGPGGVAEKDVTLAIAMELSKYLQREGYYVFMTRSSDTYVPLKRRAEIANLTGADVFVSIHCGAWYSSAAGGLRVSYYVPTGDETIDRSAAGGRGLKRGSRDPRQRVVAGLEWGGIQEGFIDESRALARAVRKRMSSELDVYDRGIGAADLTVLAGCSMPAVLVEPAFITNYSEAALLTDGGFREDVARAIALGVTDYRRATRGR